MKGLEKIELDINGRIIRQIEPATGTVYEYEYPSECLRVVTMTNENNKSNFKTIIKQNLINGEYVDTEINEFGETYNNIKKYNDKNKEIYLEQTNIITGKIYKKNSIWKDDKIHLWKTEYDGQTNVGFYMNKNIITGLTKNI